MQRDVERHSNITSYLLDDLPRHYQELLQTRSAALGKPSLRETFSELLKHLDENLRSDHISLALHDPARNTVSVILQAGEHEFAPRRFQSLNLRLAWCSTRGRPSRCRTSKLKPNLAIS
jgi:hypothetical protein